MRASPRRASRAVGGGYRFVSNQVLFAADLNAAIESSAGSLPPASPQGGGAARGKFWLDARSSTLRLFDGTGDPSDPNNPGWISLGQVDPLGHEWTPPPGIVPPAGARAGMVSGFDADGAPIAGGDFQRLLALLNSAQVANVNTIADLVASIPPIAAMPPVSVQVAGYWQAGDGGGDPFVWDPASFAASDDGLVFAGPGGEGVAGRWRRLLNRDPTVAMWGAKGDTDGSPGHGWDDTAAVAAALNSGVGRLRGVGGARYRITQPVVATVPDYFDLDLAILADPAPGFGSMIALTLGGAGLGADVAIASPGPFPGDTWLTLSATAGIHAGDWAKVWSTRWFDCSSTKTFLGEMVRVNQPDFLTGNKVTMETKFLDAYQNTRIGTMTTVSPGLGYSQGDVLTLVGGTMLGGAPAQQIVVVAVDASGAVTNWEWHGEVSYYATLPSGTVATTGGGGSGLSFTITGEAAWYTPCGMAQGVRVHVDMNCGFQTDPATGAQLATGGCQLRYCVGSTLSGRSEGFPGDAFMMRDCVSCDLPCHDAGLAPPLPSNSYAVALGWASRGCYATISSAHHRKSLFAQVSGGNVAGAAAAGITRHFTADLGSVSSGGLSGIGASPSYQTNLTSISTTTGALGLATLPSALIDGAPVWVRSTGTLPAGFVAGVSYNVNVIGSVAYLYGTYDASTAPGSPPPGAIVPTTIGSGVVSLAVIGGDNIAFTHGSCEGANFTFGNIDAPTNFAITILGAGGSVRGQSITDALIGGVNIVPLNSRGGSFDIDVGRIIGGRIGVEVLASSEPIDQLSVRAAVTGANSGVVIEGTASTIYNVKLDLNTTDSTVGPEVNLQNCANISGHVHYDSILVDGEGVVLTNCSEIGGLTVTGWHVANATGTAIYITDIGGAVTRRGLIAGSAVFCAGDGTNLTGVLIGAQSSLVTVAANNNFADCGRPVYNGGQQCLMQYRNEQRAVPSSGGTVAINAASTDLLIDPAATLASLTVSFPPNPADGQIIGIAATQAVTALNLATTDGSGMAAAASLAQGGVLARRYRADQNKWMPSRG